MIHSSRVKIRTDITCRSLPTKLPYTNWRPQNIQVYIQPPSESPNPMTYLYKAVHIDRFDGVITHFYSQWNEIQCKWSPGSKDLYIEVLAGSQEKLYKVIFVGEFVFPLTNVHICLLRSEQVASPCERSRLCDYIWRLVASIFRGSSKKLTDV